MVVTKATHYEDVRENQRCKHDGAYHSDVHIVSIYMAGVVFVAVGRER